ncbi:MAG: PH domain-containing protein [Microscillaceae bacterium]|nr:PH domain-containing protein [Microscillaceae bacterium]MDW8459839.1 PH domain-containing protein [Cytophagales bacterium]
MWKWKKNVSVELAPSERIIFQTSLHWILFVPSISIFCMGLAWNIAIFYYSNYLSMEVAKWLSWIGYGIILIGLGKFFAEYILHKTSLFVLTNQRVIIETGVLKRTSLTIMLSKVEGLKVVQTLRGRILGYGTIYITGTGGAVSRFANIRQPNVFSQKIQIAQNTNQDSENDAKPHEKTHSQSPPPLRKPKK